MKKHCPKCSFELEPLNHLGDQSLWCEECGYKEPTKIEIMNLRRYRPEFEYDFLCDRQSILGNPFRVEPGRNREMAIRLFGHYFQLKMSTNPHFRAYLFNMRRIYNQYGKLRLFCWCEPDPCHTEIIRDWILKP